MSYSFSTVNVAGLLLLLAMAEEYGVRKFESTHSECGLSAAACCCTWLLRRRARGVQVRADTTLFSTQMPSRAAACRALLGGTIALLQRTAALPTCPPAPAVQGRSKVYMRGSGQGSATILPPEFVNGAPACFKLGSMHALEEPLEACWACDVLQACRASLHANQASGRGPWGSQPRLCMRLSL